MTDTRSDPRYIRMIGLTLLAALFVVASCQVEQVSINIEVEQVTPDARANAMDGADRILEQSASLEFKLVLPVTELEPALSRIDRQIVGALGVDSLRALGRDNEGPGQAIPFTSLLRSGDVEGAYLIATEDVDVAEIYLALPEVQRALPRNVSLHWEADVTGLQQRTYRRLIVTEEDAFVTGDMLEDATAQGDPLSNRPQVAFQFNREGGRRFSTFTTQHIGDHIAIILDDEIVSRPVVRARIGASGVINLGNSASPRR